MCGLVVLAASCGGDDVGSSPTELSGGTTTALRETPPAPTTVVVSTAGERAPITVSPTSAQLSTTVEPATTSTATAAVSTTTWPRQGAYGVPTEAAVEPRHAHVGDIVALRGTCPESERYTSAETTIRFGSSRSGMEFWSGSVTLPVTERTFELDYVIPAEAEPFTPELGPENNYNTITFRPVCGAGPVIDLDLRHLADQLYVTVWPKEAPLPAQ